MRKQSVAISLSLASLCLIASPILAQAPATNLPPAPSQVFGYIDFTAQAKIDADFLAVPDAKLAGQELKTLTAKPHIASSPEDHETALFVAQKFKAAGLETEIVPYRVLLNQPRKVSFEARTDTGAILATGPKLAKPNSIQVRSYLGLNGDYELVSTWNPPSGRVNFLMWSLTLPK